MVHAVALVADVGQMYSQIVVHPHHTRLQRILWASSIGDAHDEYESNRVTFGLWCSLFIPLRNLHYLAHLVENLYPEAAKTFLDFTYVDGMAFSTPSVNLAIKLKTDLINLLQKGCFELKKWASSHREVLSDIPISDHHAISFDLEEEGPRSITWGLLRTYFTGPCCAVSFRYSVCDLVRAVLFVSGIVCTIF